MQLTKNGIPCNVQKGFHRKPKVQVVKKVAFIKPQYTHFAELTRYKDGLEQSVIGPVGTKQHRQAVKDGYETVCEWSIN